jgi:hypothetical protein
MTRRFFSSGCFPVFAVLIGVTACGSAGDDAGSSDETTDEALGSDSAALKGFTKGMADTPGDQQGGNPVPYLQKMSGASVFRIIVDPRWGIAAPLGAVTQAHQAGYHIFLSIQYCNSWSIPQVHSWFAQALETYGPLVSYVAVGNEQELAQCGKGSTGQHYSAVWKSVVPLMMQHAPHAIRVAGEVSPWGEQFLDEAFKHGLPHVQAVSGHPYPAVPVPGTTHHTPEPGYANSLRKHGLPLYFSEAMCGPNNWLGPTNCLSPARMKQLGAVLGIDWMG